MVAGVVTTPYTLDRSGPWLIARFHDDWNMLSWCVVNGGFQRTSAAAWLYLQPNEIAGVAEPADWMRARMYAENIGNAIGFMTSRRAQAWTEGAASAGACRAWAVGTVGMGNALRIGDPPAEMSPGTINLLVCVAQPLTLEAALEALCLIAEAKTLAVSESGIRSIVSQEPASGTGTDYLALAWPPEGAPSPYAGKHT